MKTFYQIVALTKTGRKWESSTIFEDYEKAVQQRKYILLETENISYAMIRELNAI